MLPIRYKILQVTVRLVNMVRYLVNKDMLPTYGTYLLVMSYSSYLPVKTTIRVLTVPTYFGLQYLKILLQVLTVPTYLFRVTVFKVIINTYLRYCG